MSTVLVTGSAGFIGARTSQLLIDQGYRVIGIDNLNNYYDVRLKGYRLESLNGSKNFVFYKQDIENIEFLSKLFKENSIDAVINLAARAGVRYSSISYFKNEFYAAQGADALVICTDWNEYRNLDLEKIKELMKGNIILDTRNILDGESARELGFVYEGVGRK